MDMMVTTGAIGRANQHPTFYRMDALLLSNQHRESTQGKNTGRQCFNRQTSCGAMDYKFFTQILPNASFEIICIIPATPLITYFVSA